MESYLQFMNILILSLFLTFVYSVDSTFYIYVYPSRITAQMIQNVLLISRDSDNNGFVSVCWSI